MTIPDGWTLARVVLLAAALPALALWLSRVVELDADAGELDAGGAVVDAGGDVETRHQKTGGPGGPVARRRRPARSGPGALTDLVAARPTIDVAAAARALGVTRPTVYAWAEAEGLARDTSGRWHNGKG